MKVYVVQFWYIDHGGVSGVFSERSLAQKFVGDQCESEWCTYSISEFLLNDKEKITPTISEVEELPPYTPEELIQLKEWEKKNAEIVKKLLGNQ